MAQGIMGDEQQVATATASFPLLLQCHPGVWAQVLLPKLVAQGSVGSVALACSTLRDLCYNSVQQLNFKIVPESVHPYTFTTVRNWALSLKAHFPSCTSISVGLGCSFDCEFVITMMPTLARLPKLKSIDLTIDAAMPRKERCRAGLESLLRTMRKHLSGLRNLSITSKQDWQGASKVWSKLAQLTQLTHLSLEFTEELSNACTESELATLGKLQQLHCLDITFTQPLTGSDDQELLLHGLVSQLTSLTELSFADCMPRALSCVSSCTTLQRLCFGCSDGDETDMAPEDWTVLGQLTGLTRLELWNGWVTTVPTECAAAFGQLRHLVSFAADVLSHDIITVLAACTNLNELGGTWCPGKDAASVQKPTSVTIPSVVNLWDAGGVVPFAVFPNLQTVLQGRPISSAALCNLSVQCTGWADAL